MFGIGRTKSSKLQKVSQASENTDSSVSTSPSTKPSLVGHFACLATLHEHDAPVSLSLGYKATLAKLACCPCPVPAKLGHALHLEAAT